MRHASTMVALLLVSGCGGIAIDDGATDPGALHRNEGSEDGTPASCALRVDPNERSFDAIAAGTTLTYELHLWNDGTEPCAVTDVVLERGHDVVHLAQVQNFTLAAGAQAPLHLTYAPTEVGVVEPTIHLRANGEVFEHGLRFQSVAAQPPGGDDCLFVTPETIEFEARTPGCGTAERAFVLHNECDYGVQVMEADTGTSTAFSRGSAPELPVEVPAGHELRFPVLYTPHEPGDVHGRLRIRVDGWAAFEAPLVGHTSDGTPVRDVFHATAGQRLFELSHRPAHPHAGAMAEELEVHVDHALVRPGDEGARNWGYGEVRNLVEFTAGKGPAEGAEVVIEYRGCAN